MNYIDYTAQQLKEQFNIDVDDDATMYRVHSDTGEIQALQAVYVPYGTTILTPQDKANIQAYKEREAYINYHSSKRAERLKQTGHFYFVKKDYDYNLRPETLVRLIYLISYLSQDGTLKLTQRKRIHKGDLSKILNLSSTTTWNFVKEVSPKYIYISDTGLITISDNCNKLFVNGKITGYSYTKIFKEGIQVLYRETESTKHKALGCVFMLLNYVNIEYNVLCYNPHETDYKKIIPMELKDFCTICGYAEKEQYRFRKFFKSLKFKTRQDTYERFCAIARFDGDTEDITRITINPNILYCGSDFNNVKCLTPSNVWE